MAKYSTKEIRQIFKEHNKTVDPDFEYKSSQDKIPYTCDKCGFRHSMLLRNLTKGGYGNGVGGGKHCPKCRKREKIDYSIPLEESFAFEEYKIIGIKGNKFSKDCRIYYMCPKGHEYNVLKYYWCLGKRCPYCEELKKYPDKDIRLITFPADRDKVTMCDIKEAAHSYGFRLSSVGKYSGNHEEKLNFECIRRNHKIKLSVVDLRNNKGCEMCEQEDLFNEIRKLFDTEGYTLLIDLEKEYKDQQTFFECIHDECGNKFKTNWNRFGYHKQRCPKCQSIVSGTKRSGSSSSLWKNYSEEDIKKSRNYRSNVSQLTDQNYKKYKDIINPLNLDRTRGEHNLDHIYPVMEGFRNNIPPKVISNPSNLQMLAENINIAKSDKLNISLEELYNKYNHWNEKSGNK